MTHSRREIEPGTGNWKFPVYDLLKNACWGPADARLKRAGVSVWSLIGYLRAFGEDSERVGEAFALSPEELAAALAYFRHDEAYIEARLLLNSA